MWYRAQGKVTIFRTLSNYLKHTGAECHHMMYSKDAVEFVVCKRLIAAGHGPVKHWLVLMSLVQV